jgi:hypothetical protein
MGNRLSFKKDDKLNYRNLIMLEIAVISFHITAPNNPHQGFLYVAFFDHQTTNNPIG